jgi:hypothetical protein
VSSSNRQIGFSSQRIQYKWLVKVANLKLAGMEHNQIKSEILDYLAEWLPNSGASDRSSRDKALTVLLRTWISPDRDLHGFRDDGLALIQSANDQDQRVIHWGMLMASYRFWGDVADSVGRLLRLQSTIETAQIRRRMKELYGDREVVARATRNVISSFVDWNVLQAGDARGVYQQSEKFKISNPAVTTWILEAALRSQEKKAVPVGELIGSPRMFPFILEKTNAGVLVSHSARLDVLRHGLDNDLIMLTEPYQST